MMLIPAIPRQPAADLLTYAQEAVTIGHSLIAEGGRQDGDLRLPTLRHPPDAVEKQTPFLLVTLANHESDRGTFDLSGPLASVLIAHRPKHASQRQDRGRKRKKLQGVVAKSILAACGPPRATQPNLPPAALSAAVSQRPRMSVQSSIL